MRLAALLIMAHLAVSYLSLYPVHFMSNQYPDMNFPEFDPYPTYHIFEFYYSSLIVMGVVKRLHAQPNI